MAVSLFLDGFTSPSVVRIEGVTQADLKGADDFYLPAAQAPVARGSRSYIKHIAGRLLGTWTSLLNGYAYRDGSESRPLDSSLIFGCATTSYRGPTNGALGGTVLAGASVGATNGPNTTLTLGFGQCVGNANGAAASNNLGSTVFTNFLCLQLQATPSMAEGPIGGSSWKFVINEN